MSRTHLGQVSVAKTPTQATPLVWKDPTVRGSLWWLMAGNAGENSPALGCQRWENTVLRGSVGASSAWFHRASPEGFSVCIRTGQTGRHWPGAWHCSPCPLPALPALMDAGQHPPESRTARPGAVASRRKGWGEKKDGGGGYFQLMKNCDWFRRLRRGCSRPVSQLLISFQAWRGKSSNACPVSALSSKARPFWL